MLPSQYTPLCPGLCIECLYMMRGQKYWYMQGDLIIPSIFDLHYAGNAPFTCGAMKTSNGLQYLEAFAFALEKINNGTATIGLNNVRLGGLALDGCSSSSRATAYVNNLQSGSLVLQDSNMNLILNQNFLSWLSYDSQSTIDVADILSTMGIPIVSPGATAPLLFNKQRFSTFFRTIPSDTVVARGMAQFAKKMNFNYVITLNAPDTGNRGARDEFRKIAEAEGLCILASYEFVTDGNMEIILGSIVQSTTKVVAVFAEPDQYIKELIDTKYRRFPNVRIVFIANRPWRVREFQNPPSVMDSVTFSMNNPVIEDFRAYLANRIPGIMDKNPWLQEYYQAKFDCNLQGQFGKSRACQLPLQPLTNNFQQDIWVLSTINAVYALAEGVRRTLVEKCGVNYSGVCSNFRYSGDTYTRVMKNMDNETFIDLMNETFRFIEREANKGYIINQFLRNGDQKKLGDYRDKTLTLRDETQRINVTSRCDDDCLVCQKSNSSFQDFTYIPGNIYLVGLFDVHKQGATPYTCGEINTKHGLPLLEAFNYAIEYVNNRTGIFKDKLDGIVLGGIGLDICKSPTRAANLVANIHSGNINLRVGQRTISPSTFDVYIGTMETESSLRVGDVLNTLSIPQVSYGATSLELRDFRKYRYFLRTVPADDKQARGMISYLKRFDINNVQVINTFDSVGEKGRQEFLRLAYLNRICVSQNITIGQNGPVSMAEARNALAKVAQNRDAKVVILFVDNPRPILQAAEPNPDITNNYFFIGTDKWGADPDMLVGLSEVLKNKRSVTFDVESADLPGFDKYLETKSPLTYNRNPWFKEYYERVFGCTVGNVPNRRSCGTQLLGLPRSNGYIQDPYVLYVVNAVFSAALGIDQARNTLCARNVMSSFCNLFRTSGERRQEIYNGMKNATFTDATKQPFYFTPDGESDRGYHIYEPILNPTGPGYIYEDVGSYNDTHYLKLDIRYEINRVSNCNNANSCPCVFPVYQPSRFMSKPSPNDLNLIYFGDIHQSNPVQPFGCGAIDTTGNFQNMMAFFYAISLVNQNSRNRLPSSLKLGGIAVDTCSHPRGIGRDIYSLLSGEAVCGSGLTQQVIAPSTVVAFVADRSSNAIPVSGILSPLKVTSISQSATSVTLSNKQYHSYFLRTVPPDTVQAVVILEVMKQFNWDYATVIYSDDVYGNTAMSTLLSQAATGSNQVCVGQNIKMESGATITRAEAIVDQLSQQVGARIVILFTTPEHSRLLLEATRKKGLSRRFVWLASDTWANSQYIVNGFEEEASGAITIQIRSEEVTQFRQYLKNLTLTNRGSIPNDWFEEFYQRIHQCRLLTSTIRQSFPRICTGQERITDSMIPQDPFVLHTIISVFMVARGLNNIQECRSSRFDLAACMALQENRRELIYRGIRGAQWDVLPEQLKDKSFTFSFSSSGYGDIGYNILNFYRSPSVDKYIYAKIGTYQASLSLDRSLYRGFSLLDTAIVPSSRCPVGSTCTCLNADGVTTRNYKATITPASASSAIVLSADGTYIDSRTGAVVKVEDVPSLADRYTDIWGIIVATLAAIGVFVSLCLFIYLLVVYPNRGGTSILGYLLAFSIILLYALVFAFIMHASSEICGLRRFCLGFCYAICYAALLVKLIDCWRVAGKPDEMDIKYNKLGRPSGLFLVALLLILVQVIINAEWLILTPPGVNKIFYNNKLWPRCAPDAFYDQGLVLSLVYVMVLIVLCVIFGFITWKSPKNHHESRWILGASILSIPCFVVWCLVSIMGAYKVRDAAVAVGLLINATMMLLCGPLRKLYLLNRYQVLLEEEEQAQQSVLADKGGANDYSSVYHRQYDNIPHFHESHSVRGSTHGSVRDGIYSSVRMGTMQSAYSGSRGGAYMESVQSSYGRSQGGAVIEGMQSSHGGTGGSVHMESMQSSYGGSQGGTLIEGMQSSHGGAGSSAHMESMQSSYSVSHGGAQMESAQSSHVSEHGGVHVESMQSSHSVSRGGGYMESTKSSYEYSSYSTTGVYSSVGGNSTTIEY